MLPRRSLENVLAQYKGLGPGFDFLRIALATLIVLSHAFFNSSNESYIRGNPLWFLEYGLVPMFFALSGFLIAASAQRLSLKNFLINRGLRIVPALAVDIVVCALIIGPIVTTIPLSAYFADSDFFRYFLNITGWIHYQLPGVFKNNPTSQVNGALWTVPWELMCYVLMSGMMITGVIKSQRLTLILLAVYVAAGLVVQFLGVDDDMVGKLLVKAFTSRGSQVVAAFLCGIVVYQNRHLIPYHWGLFYVSIATCIGGAIYLSTPTIEMVPNRIILLPALAYATVFVGLTPVPIPQFLKRGDYSYGIYLYHDPFLQILMLLFPFFIINGALGAILLFVIGLVVVGVVASLSWHFVEKPILAQRKRFSFVARVRGVEDAPLENAGKQSAATMAN